MIFTILKTKTHLITYEITIMNDGTMNSENASKEMVKSFIDLANMANALMDENQQASVQQYLEKLFPSTRGGRRGDESRELYRVGAGKPSASTTTDTNTSICISCCRSR